jgi:chloramphenicol O-acetyltransferase
VAGLLLFGLARTNCVFVFNGLKQKKKRNETFLKTKRKKIKGQKQNETKKFEKPNEKNNVIQTSSWPEFERLLQKSNRI